MIRINGIRLSLTQTEEKLQDKILKTLRITPADLRNWKIVRRSLDARKKEDIHYVYVIDAEVKNEKKLLAKDKKLTAAPDESYHFPEGSWSGTMRPVVVGFGPAGMFAALILAEMGLNPLILERGGDVDSRREAVDTFWESGKLSLDNNVQFGEGGAGAFSDGKLTTRIKDGRCHKVLEELVEAGAPEEILYENKPHVGTDRLQPAVKNIRKKIIALGGEVRFFTQVTDLVIKNGALQAVVTQNGEEIPCQDAIFALGHSARDTFFTLYENGIAMEQKPFAMGVRIEHDQQMINESQYGSYAGKLPAADYRLTYTTQKGRGVYSFCMCPGGYVVAASSEEGRLAVNGMSYHARDGKNANAALLVQVYPEDFGDSHPLAGVRLQRKLEEAAFRAGGGDYTAPVQRVGSFLTGKEVLKEETEVQPTYRPGVKETDLHEVLPTFITEALEEALPQMGKKLHGFDCPNAIMTAVESRSSSPVRLLRGGDGQSLSLSGFFPAGEGAGYAGGIVSAAVDGIRAAEKIWEKYQNV